MAVRIQFRRGTAAEWAAANPTLAAGELGYESDTGQFKIGNGSQNWNALSYGAVSESYVNDAIANVIDLAPETLDTLNELAAALGDDPNAFANLNSAIDNLDNAIVLAEDNAKSYSNTILISAQSYTDNAISDLIDSSPTTLDTLNELAAALGDDPNFATTTATSIGQRLKFVADTHENFGTANAVTLANTAYVATNYEGYVKLGDGVTHYNDLKFVGEHLTDARISTHSLDTTDVHGITNTLDLVYTGDLTAYAPLAVTNDLSNGINTVSNTVSTLGSDLTALSNTVTSVSNLLDDTIDDVTAIDDRVTAVEGALPDLASINSPTIENLTTIGNTVLSSNTTIGTITSTQIGYLGSLTSDIQDQIDGIQDQVDLKADLSGPTFVGNVVLPQTTEIGDVSGTEISYLNGVTSSIQDQIDGKLSTAAASTTYAALAGATFSGNVVLTANTSIGAVDSTEISYLNGVTSSIQDQLDDKAPIESPTFTGTVSGVTKSMVGLGNVDNTSDADKPISTATQSALDLKANSNAPTFTGTVVLPSTTSIGNVSATEIGYLDGVTSAIQTQLNAKLDLSGGTMTGKIVLDGDPTQALHPATKQYVDNISAGLHVHEAAHAATPSSLATLTGGSVTYNNGTDGVGATLTLGVALTTLDGHSLTNGDRILVKNESNAAHNGIYVRTSSTVLTRADDFNSAAEIAGGDLVFVENGTLYNTTSWVVENEVNTVGTDNILWAQFSGAGTVTAGNNISVSGLQVSVADSPSFTGTVTLPSTTSIGSVSATEIGFLDGVTSSIQTQINAKANTASPTFTGLVTVAANGIAFADGTQIAEGVPSRTVILQQTGSYTLTGIERDDLIEMSSTSAITLTIPTDATFNFPIGTSIDILQTNTGQVTIAGAGGVTVNATPGLKLRTQWSSATLFKRAANTWVVYGDLTA